MTIKKNRRAPLMLFSSRVSPIIFILYWILHLLFLFIFSFLLKSFIKKLFLLFSTFSCMRQNIILSFRN